MLVRFFCIKLVKEQRIRSAMQCRCVDLFPSQKAPTTKTIRFLGEPGVDLLDCENYSGHTSLNAACNRRVDYKLQLGPNELQASHIVIIFLALIRYIIYG